MTRIPINAETNDILDALNSILQKHRKDDIPISIFRFLENPLFVNKNIRCTRPIADTIPSIIECLVKPLNMPDVFIEILLNP